MILALKICKQFDKTEAKINKFGIYMSVPRSKELSLL